MRLSDAINAHIWILWAIFALFAVISIVLLSGHGANLIAGYNTSSQEEKDKYDKRKLCRIIGSGMALIAIMLLVMAIWADRLPLFFIYVFLVVVIVDSIVIAVLSNTKCKR